LTPVRKAMPIAAASWLPRTVRLPRWRSVSWTKAWRYSPKPTAIVATPPDMMIRNEVHP